MKAIFIYNPNSGRGKVYQKEKWILGKLSSRFDEIEVKKTESPHHATLLAKEACGKCDTLIVAGGDGTMNEIINGLVGEENIPTIGYIPVGTVNDLAHSLKIPCSVKKAVKNILSGKEFSHDVFKAGDKYGIYVACAGIYTEMSYGTSQSKKKKFGKIAYIFHGLKKIYNTKAVNLTLKYDGGEIKGRYAFVLISNSKNTASFKLNRKAFLDDGKVDVALVEEKKEKICLRSRLKVVSLFLFGLSKKKLCLDKFSLSIDAPLNIDGEQHKKGDFDFEVLNKKVKIIVPNKFKG